MFELHRAECWSCSLSSAERLKKKVSLCSLKIPTSQVLWKPNPGPILTQVWCENSNAQVLRISRASAAQPPGYDVQGGHLDQTYSTRWVDFHKAAKLVTDQLCGYISSCCLFPGSRTTSGPFWADKDQVLCTGGRTVSSRFCVILSQTVIFS